MAELLLAEGHDVAFVGTPGGLEARLVPEAGIDFFPVPARGFDRGRVLTLVSSTAITLAAIGRAHGVIKRFRPDVLLGFGGYVSLPVGLAAAVARVPLALHEQNSLPGLANRVLSRWSLAVGVTYEGSIRHLAHPDRVRITGNPVRPEVLDADRRRGRSAFGVPDDATLLLVFGGSRGARHVNEAMMEMAPALMALSNLYVVHASGRDEYDSVSTALAQRVSDAEGRYRVVPYIESMGDALAAADLVVARAGATSIAEITAVGRPAVLVPYPYATDDHQTLNARAVANAGGAMVVADVDLGQPVFADTVLRLLRDPSRRETMAAAAFELARPDATRRVADLALHVAGERRERR